MRWLTFSLLLTQHLLPSCHGFWLQLFDTVNYDGLFFESNSLAECTNLPQYGLDKASSLKTDECVIFYRDVDCAPTWSIKVPAGEYTNLTQFTRASSNLDKSIKSFHLCNPSNGGQSLNVDLKSSVGDEAETLVEYRGLCGCAILPLYSSGQVNSLNNYGNCVKLWKEYDCTGDAIEVLGGVGEETNDLSLVNFAHVTKSISGCGAAEECIRMHSEVIKFVINATNIPEKYADAMESGNMEMSARTVFRNNGSATVSQQYVAKQSTTEVTEVTRESTMSSFSSVKSPNARVDVSSSSSTWWAGWIKRTATTVITEAYTYEDSSFENEYERETYTKTEEVEFTATQRIEIAPCSTYAVSSYLKVVKNVPVNYEVHSHVSGTKGMQVMNTQELKEKLVGLEYLGDHDNQTIIVRGFGTINAGFGVEAIIDGEGAVMQDCRIPSL